MECHLKTHLQTEHRCRICQGLWPDRPSLEAHARAHRLGNHYRCERCGYLSKTANKLIEHVRVHTGERPFHCDRCPYRCKRKDNLNLHKRLKHAPPTHRTSRAEAAEEGDCGTGRETPVGLGGLSASRALRSVALTRTLGGGPRLAHPNSRSSSGCGDDVDPYRNCERAHLIPLSTLFTHSFTFHTPPRLPAATHSTAHSAAPSPASHKHSFLAYLGLRERAETV